MRKFIPIILLISVLTVLFFYKLTLTDLILARGDTYNYFYPYWDVRDTALSNGHLPLWTPDIFMGAPLLANPQIGTFYPPNWLTIPFNTPDAIRMSILLHVIWGTLGAYLLARKALSLDVLPSIVAACVFGLSGHMLAHVEQINQLQGLSWMPYIILLFIRSTQSRLYIVLMGGAWGMQLLSGHTQTVFITGFGQGLYALWLMGTAYRQTDSRITPAPVLIILGAILIAVLLALPQLMPTQQLISMSNRDGGFTAHQATAFSLNPLLIGRGLLPAYDSQLFTEYIAYIGVIGLGLAVSGALSQDKRRWVWLVIALIGLFFALGRNNPLYWPLAHLPGFNFFRVPARWLALFTLGGSMLAGIGLQSLAWNRRTFITLTFIVGGLVALSFLADGASDEIDGAALPTMLTIILWSAGFIMFNMAAYFLSHLPARGDMLKGGLVVLLIVELFAASQVLPLNDLTDPAVYNNARFTVRQMQAYAQQQNPPGRLLSISDLRFFPGDEDVLKASWGTAGLNERATDYALTATKAQEVIAPNQSLTWGIPSVDGAGGGILPTEYYSAFTSLMLPDGVLRTIDGRLREVLALPQCRGACILDDRWLDLTNTHYLLTDKVYDVVHDGIFYDTQFSTHTPAWVTTKYRGVPEFVTTHMHLLYTGDTPPALVVRTTRDFTTPVYSDPQIEIDGLKLAIYEFEAPVISETLNMRVEADTDNTYIRAITLVDARTADFMQLAAPGWQRVYSADVKIYENLDVLPRAFFVGQAVIAPDTWLGTEQALDIMRHPDFDPARVVMLNSNAAELPDFAIGGLPPVEAQVDIIEYTANRVVIDVTTNAPGYIVLTDAYYPHGWSVAVTRDDNQQALAIQSEIYRANIMFRAVPVTEGQQTLTFTYRLPVPMTAWAFFYIIVIGVGLYGWHKLGI